MHRVEVGVGPGHGEHETHVQVRKDATYDCDPSNEARVRARHAAHHDCTALLPGMAASEAGVVPLSRAQ